MGDFRTQGATPTAKIANQNQSSNTSRGRASGSFHGAKVKVIDQNSLIADALEELTEARSEDEEKDASDREVEDGRKTDSFERIFHIEEIQRLSDKLGDLPKRDLKFALRRVLKQREDKPEGWREKARQSFEEPAHQYALLKTTIAALKARGASSEEIQSAEKALSTLLEDEGTRIRAALNIGETAQDFALDNLASIPELRHGYVSTIQNYNDMTAAMNNLVERFGEDKIAEAIDFMLKGLAADMNADGASIDKHKLKMVVDDMHRLEALTTILTNCKYLSRRAIRMGGDEDFTGEKMMRKLVPLMDEKWIRPKEVDKITLETGLEELAGQISFLTDLKEVARLIPQKSFAKVENREKLLDAVQQTLDTRIEQEEEDEA
ncbi:MAG: type III secretion system gatekeeper subunit SctW [Pseudomonadota bacterium]